MKETKKTTSATRITYQGYGYGFKVNIVEQIENGQLSMNQAATQYEVSRSSVQEWVRKYGNLDKKLKSMGGRSPKQEIAALKKKLKQAELEREILKLAVEIVEDEYGIDVKKKYLNNYQKDILRNIKKD